jgi:hypothetical protein
MAEDVQWSDLRPILRDMADRIARIEQFLAASGPQAPGDGSGAVSGSSGQAADVFDSVPASFDALPAAAGISSFSAPQRGAVPDDIVLMARSGRMIQAINEYRRLTGMSLKDSRAAVQQAAVRGY